MVCHVSQCPGYYLFLLTVKVLEDVVLRADNGDGNWYDIQGVLVWVVSIVPRQTLRY